MTSSIAHKMRKATVLGVSFGFMSPGVEIGDHAFLEEMTVSGNATYRAGRRIVGLWPR